MKTKYFLQLTLILSLIGFLSACAGESSPVTNRTPSEDKGTTSGTTLLDAIVSQGVPENVAKLALSKYDDFAGSVKRTDNIAIIDFTVYSGKPRFYLIDTASGQVDAIRVAHGSGSDPNGTGTPTVFSNTPESHMTSLGAYVVSETLIFNPHGTAARMDGLESTNNLARQRGILLHSANYMASSLAQPGMSWGCAAVSVDTIGEALKRLDNGGFLYAYGPPQSKSLDDSHIERLMNDPFYIWADESAAPPEGEW